MAGETEQTLPFRELMLQRKDGFCMENSGIARLRIQDN